MLRVERKNAERRRVEREMLRFDQCQSNPTHSQNAAELAMRKECNISIQCAQVNDEPVGTVANLCRRFAVRTTIPKHVPVRPHFSDVHGALPFIIAIIPFRKVRFYFGGLI